MALDTDDKMTYRLTVKMDGELKDRLGAYVEAQDVEPADSSVVRKALDEFLTNRDF